MANHNKEKIIKLIYQREKILYKDFKSFEYLKWFHNNEMISFNLGLGIFSNINNSFAFINFIVKLYSILKNRPLNEDKIFRDFVTENEDILEWGLEDSDLKEIWDIYRNGLTHNFVAKEGSDMRTSGAYYKKDDKWIRMIHFEPEWERDIWKNINKRNEFWAKLLNKYHDSIDKPFEKVDDKWVCHDIFLVRDTAKFSDITIDLIKKSDQEKINNLGRRILQLENLSSVNN